MKHKVVSKFLDNETGRLYPVNSFYESEDAKRVLFLKEKGLIELNKQFNEDGGSSGRATKNSKSDDKDAEKSPSKTSKKSKSEEVKKDE